jgi:hypothetical protein
MTSRATSIPRRHYLWVLLTLLVGWLCSGKLTSSAATASAEKWGEFASVVASVAASMVGLTVAVTALVYALLGTPLIKFLHERGALNRLLFDLMVCALMWLVALVTSLVAAHPGAPEVTQLMQVSSMFALAGAVHFLPIGWAFWTLLHNSGKSQATAIQHDFSKKTEII